jgi:hypothetical protein
MNPEEIINPDDWIDDTNTIAVTKQSQDVACTANAVLVHGTCTICMTSENIDKCSTCSKSICPIHSVHYYYDPDLDKFNVVFCTGCKNIKTKKRKRKS